MAIALLFISMIAFLTISLPIGMALGLATAITLAYSGSIPLILLAQNAFTALDSFPLLAIPYFMLAGALMGYGGISRRLVTLSESLVGAITGGLAMVTVTACMFFAAISGSGPATVTAIGSFMVPAMKEKNYDKEFATALVATAGSIGVIIPPSIPFVLFGVISGVSIGNMFIAGIIPGIIIGIALMILSYRIAKKKGYPKCQDRVPLGKAFKDAFWALLIPVIILGGIYAGIFTPTESAVAACVYSIFIGKYIYKELSWNALYDIFKDVALLNGATNHMIGLSMSFAAYLTMEQVPIQLCNYMLSMTDNLNILLLLILILLLIVGCFVDNISSMIILTPILLPIVTKFGMDPIHFGLVMTIALAIGFITPPYGANLFVATAVSGVSLIDLAKEIKIFVVVMMVCLLVFTYVPQISLFLVYLLQ